jgi:nickel/cobalt transporter (NiCoT) family protein
VIVGMIFATWIGSVLIWRFARIEQKWSAGLDEVTSQ